MSDPEAPIIHYLQPRSKYQSAMNEDLRSVYHQFSKYLATAKCFNNGYVGKQPVAWKEYCAEY